MGRNERVRTMFLLCLGTSLSLWLCSLAMRRLWREVVESSVRLMRESMRAAGVQPAEVREALLGVEPPTRVLWEPDHDEPLDEPLDDAGGALDRRAVGKMPWAEGMTPEDLRRGIDPLTGRPLEW